MILSRLGNIVNINDRKKIKRELYVNQNSKLEKCENSNSLVNKWVACFVLRSYWDCSSFL